MISVHSMFGKPNARINRARRTADTDKFSIKAALFALRLNELLCRAPHVIIQVPADLRPECL
jgi:hypothetical protein